MIPRTFTYERPDTISSENPNETVAQYQLKSLAGIREYPVEFSSDIFDLLSYQSTDKLFTTDDPTAPPPGVSGPLMNSYYNNQVYSPIFQTIVTGGAKAVTIVVGPSSNADSDSYDYTTDGTADQVQIAAALAALPSSGGTVLLREGAYALSDDFSDNNPNLRLVGVGPATILSSSSETVDRGILLGGDGSSVSYLKCDGVFLQITGEGSSIHHCVITDLYSTSCAANDIYACHFSAWGLRAQDNDPAINGVRHLYGNIFDGTSTYIGAQYVTSDYNDYLVQGNTFILPANYAGSCIDGGAGIATVTSNSFDMASGTIGEAFIIDVGSVSIVIGNHLFLGATLTTNLFAIAIAVGASSRVVGNHIEGVPGDGIYLGGGFCVAEGNMINGVSGFGIIANDKNIVSNNKILNVSQAADDTYYSIALETNVDHCVVNGNICTNTAVNQPKYCINEGSGCDSNIITSNVATGGVTGQINIVGGASVSANNIVA